MSLQKIETEIDNARDWGITALRLAVGIIFVMHGGQKIFSHGLGGVTDMFGSIGIPLPMFSALMAMAAEFLGGIALIVGFKTRWASVPLAFTMVVGFITVHASNGFFMSNGGFEYVLMLFAANVALFFLGSGKLSVDAALRR